MNLYIGSHKTSQASPTPTTPKEDVKTAQYYRSDYKDLSRPFLEKKMRHLGDAASKFRRDGDFLHGFLSGPLERTPCDIGLVTSGAFVNTAEHFSVIGFANTPHTDSCDTRFRQKANCIPRLNDAVAKANTINGYDHSNLEYITKFGKKLGYGRPTTCAYQWVTDEEFDEFRCYFLFNTLGICVRITDFVGHQFYAHVATHHTSCCLVVVKGKVHFLSKEGLYNLFAWGEG
jgi:hypothetical protein